MRVRRKQRSAVTEVFSRLRLCISCIKSIDDSSSDESRLSSGFSSSQFNGFSVVVLNDIALSFRVFTSLVFSDVLSIFVD